MSQFYRICSCSVAAIYRGGRWTFTHKKGICGVRVTSIPNGRRARAENICVSVGDRLLSHHSAAQAARLFMPSNIYVLRLCLSKENKKKCLCARAVPRPPSRYLALPSQEMSLWNFQGERETFEILRATEIWFRLHVWRRRARVRQGSEKGDAIYYVRRPLERTPTLTKASFNI